MKIFSILPPSVASLFAFVLFYKSILKKRKHWKGFFILKTNMTCGIDFLSDVRFRYIYLYKFKSFNLFKDGYFSGWGSGAQRCQRRGDCLSIARRCTLRGRPITHKMVVRVMGMRRLWRTRLVGYAFIFGSCGCEECEVGLLPEVCFLGAAVDVYVD